MSKHKPSTIRVSISDNGISCKGYYFDSKGMHNGFNRSFGSEETMGDYFADMREKDCEFNLVVERNYIKWSA